jgi:hypothetical protein
MRNLSERASSCTKETALLIGSLQEDTTSAAKSLAECGVDLETPLRRIREAGEVARKLLDLRRRCEESAISLLTFRREGSAGLMRDVGAKRRHLAESAAEILRVDREVIHTAARDDAGDERALGGPMADGRGARKPPRALERGDPGDSPEARAGAVSSASARGRLLSIRESDAASGRRSRRGDGGAIK